MKIEWILCPFCGSKTRLKIRNDTILDNFPLYCPKCKHETLIAVRKLNLSTSSVQAFSMTSTVSLMCA